MAMTGRRGIRFQVTARQHQSDASLVILGGKWGDSAPVLDELQAQKVAVEEAFGEPLTRAVGQRSRIYALVDGGYLDREDWPAIQSKLAEAMGRLAAVMRPKLASGKRFARRLAIFDNQVVTDWELRRYFERI